ncbi:MAG: pseudouridine synthase [Candidatus Nanoarchaeia archaeon]
MHRVQKIIANAGYCSRRKAEELIEQDKVQVNGETITIGDKADPEKDKITIDGKQLRMPKRRYIVFHKPRGYLTTLDDPKNRKTIFHFIKTKERLIPIGRLDMNTAGLILLTNDGDFANRIMHPRYEVEKTYQAELDKPLTPPDHARLERGVTIEGQRTWPAMVQKHGKNTYHITIHEGKNRIIRKMMRKLKYKVLNLKRVAISNLTLKGLPEGKWRDLTRKEKKDLMEG